MKFSRCYLLRTACAAFLGLLMLSPAFAQPPGKGGGKDKDKDAGSTLPADLDVRYRVQFVPIPTAGTSEYFMHDINDVGEAVGRYVVDNCSVGFHYNIQTDTLLTVDQMIFPAILPEQWVSTSLIGINNWGVIVGLVQDEQGFRQGILIYPSEEGYDFEISSSGNDDVSFFPEGFTGYYRKINDFGDIVGIYWDADGMRDAFTCNPGFYPLELRDFTPFHLPGNPHPDSVRLSNARRGTAVANGRHWLNLFDGLNFSHGTFSPIDLPPDTSFSGDRPAPSHDGQLAVGERTGNRMNFRYTPGVVVDGEYVWQGNLDDGSAVLVNSAAVNSYGEWNVVGDVVGHNNKSGVSWLRHADHPEWGYLDLDAMVVFSSDADAQRWSLKTRNGMLIREMSERDSTGFAVLAGTNFHNDPDAAYVLVPEIGQ